MPASTSALPAVLAAGLPSGSRSRLLSPVAAVAGLHALGCALFAAATWVHDGPALPLTAGLAAYLLGIRHAFDADHIVAIDNTTRLLRARGRRPEAVGFWFSLGHSTVVLIACVLLGVGWHSLTAQISGTETAGGAIAHVWGPTVSGTFLMLLAAHNARTAIALWRDHDTIKTDALPVRGAVTRLIGSRWQISRPRQMVVVGFLFGLGFDTATSVGLLLLAAGAEQGTLSWIAVTALPLLFAAGMTLFDGTNGAVMDRAYGWADSGRRRRRYNLAITGVSVAAAAIVGALTLMSMIGELLPT
jgi:high-affinity nickel-transport protein